jgi:hypothetical protein
VLIAAAINAGKVRDPEMLWDIETLIEIFLQEWTSPFSTERTLSSWSPWLEGGRR